MVPPGGVGTSMNHRQGPEGETAPASRVLEAGWSEAVSMQLTITFSVFKWLKVSMSAYGIRPQIVDSRLSEES